MSKYVYYQPNKKDLRDKVGDCQIRALSKALGLTWSETFDLITPICRDQQVMDVFSCDLAKTKEALTKLGFTYHVISNKRGTRRPTVATFARSHNKGRYIASVAHHVVAIVDGKYFDTWDSGDKCLYGYYELTGEPETNESGGNEYRVRAYFTDVYAPRSYKRKVVYTREDAEKLLTEAREYYSTYKYLDRVVIESRKVGKWS